jgi:hypothetical protein
MAGTAQAEDNGVGYLLKGWSKIDKAAARLRGRVLGSLIREGMTEKQVSAILGERWSSGWFYAGGMTMCVSHRSNVCVVFETKIGENTWVSRVSAVSFPSSLFSE